MYMWILFGLLSAITAALMTIAGKLGLQHVDPTFATGIRSFFMFLFMVCVIVLSGKIKYFATLDQKAFWTIVISAVFGALSWLFYFLALKIAPATKVAALDRLSLIFVIILSVLFLSEKLTIKSSIGAILATAGILLLTIG